MTTKTVTELADLFGVSRQAMNNRVRALGGEFVELNKRGFTVVNEAGIRELEEIYGKVVTAKVGPVHSEEAPVSAAPQQSKQDQTIFAMLSKLMEDKNEEISRLDEQVAIKDQQITMLGQQIQTKDRQIAEKDKQLDQQQQLTAAAMQDREQILLELKEEQGKGFFARLFRSKKQSSR